MGVIFTLFTLSGPIVGGLGFYFGIPIMFLIGVALAGTNLLMNLLSGAMNFPLFPMISVALGSLVGTPWYVGAGSGLLAYTAVEGLGEFLPVKFWRRGDSRSKRYVPFLTGLFTLLVSGVIIFGLEGWWRYLLTVPLLAFGWVSLKTAIFATDKEIRELTDDALISEETKKRFWDRL